jgi:hypothetical protein
VDATLCSLIAADERGQGDSDRAREAQPAEWGDHPSERHGRADSAASRVRRHCRQAGRERVSISCHLSEVRRTARVLLIETFFVSAVTSEEEILWTTLSRRLHPCMLQPFAGHYHNVRAPVSMPAPCAWWFLPCCLLRDHWPLSGDELASGAALDLLTW